MKLRITARTTDIGRGTPFDILVYTFFTALFFGFSARHFVEGEWMFGLIFVFIAVLNGVIVVSNFKKRKLIKEKDSK